MTGDAAVQHPRGQKHHDIRMALAGRHRQVRGIVVQALIGDRLYGEGEGRRKKAAENFAAQAAHKKFLAESTEKPTKPPDDDQPQA